MAKKKQPKKDEETGLNHQQESFCNNYVSKDFFGNGVHAYADAYGIDLTQEGQYDCAKVSASNLLTIPNIFNRINSLLDDAGLNDSFVDKQLLFMITQHAEMSTKLGAIREYNKLKQRITEKKEVTVKKIGKDLEEEIYE